MPGEFIPFSEAAALRAKPAKAKANGNAIYHPPRTMTAAELGAMTFPPVQWAVPGVIPEGCTILAGRPKLGKSWFMLDAALAVARGDFCFGDIQCPPGDVLYLALEDNARRLRSRVDKITPALSADAWPTAIIFATEWPRCDDGGLTALRSWAASMDNPRLIVVDVLQQFRSSRGDRQSLYEADYEAVKALQGLASELGIAVVVIHHVRKGGADGDPFERVSGTMGLTGAADTVIILDKTGTGCTLYARGRDLEEYDKAITFSRNTCRWTIQGDASEVRHSDERSVIIDALKDAGEPLSPSAIAIVTGCKPGNIRRLLGKMVRDGEVATSRGKYGVHPKPPGNSGNSGNNRGDDG